MKVYLDQNILSNLAKGVDSRLTKAFVKLVNDTDSELVLSFSHVLETVKAKPSLRSSISGFVSSVKYIYIEPVNVILDKQMKVLFKAFIHRTDPEEITPFGQIFHVTDKAMSFSSLVEEAESRHLDTIKLMDDNVSRDFQVIQDKRIKDGWSKEKQLKYEISELVKSFFEVREIWQLPSMLALPRPFVIEQKVEFFKNFNLNQCPLILFYTAFQTFKYRGGIKISRDAVYDAENAVLAAYYCDFLICEKNIKEILKQVNNYVTVKAKIFTSVDDFLEGNIIT